MATEDLHHLDIVLDSSRWQWDHIIQMLSLYRSAPIYSNGKYKIITDRADLPVRMMFHAGNMIPGKTEIRMGGNPVKPNQANVTYANKDNHYALDILYVQDSGALNVLNEPLKTFDMNMVGISRKTELLRQSSLFLKRNRARLYQVNWATTLEALPIEPGDRVKVGFVTTDWQSGYGGRAVGGDTSQIILDREIAINSGFTYEMMIWHTAADTYEQRTIANSPTPRLIIANPTLAFDHPVLPSDRWGIGVSSRDFFDLRVTNVQRAADGGHQLAGESFLPLDFDLRCDSLSQANEALQAPSQPSTVTLTITNCIVCVQMRQAVSSLGGSFTRPGTEALVYNDVNFGFPTAFPEWNGVTGYVGQQLSVGSDSLWGQKIHFTSGINSGRTTYVSYWGPASKQIAWAHPYGETPIKPPNSGDTFYLEGRSISIAGARIDIRKTFLPLGAVPGNSANSGTARFGGGGNRQYYRTIGNITGNSGCISVEGTYDDIYFQIIPYNIEQRHNFAGPLTFSMAALGCADVAYFSDPRTQTGSSTNNIYTVILPGSEMGLRNGFEGVLDMFVMEACSAAGEFTELKFGLTYGSLTIIDSLVVTLNTTNSWATLSPSTNVRFPAQLEWSLTNLGVTNLQQAIMTYKGPVDSAAYMEIGRSGIGSISSVVNNSFSIFASFFHALSGASPHSHNCFSLLVDHAEAGFTDVDSTGF